MVPPAALAALVAIASVPAAFVVPASKYTEIKIRINYLVKKYLKLDFYLNLCYQLLEFVSYLQCCPVMSPHKTGTLPVPPGVVVTTSRSVHTPVPASG